ncbi:hypothetical protein GQ457_07G008280 [Hibiscus cannabinus]
MVEIIDQFDNGNNPYYLHQSDNPSMVLVTQSLTNDNYNSLRRFMQMVLSANNKIGFVDVSIPFLSIPDHTMNHFASFSLSRVISETTCESSSLQVDPSPRFHTSLQPNAPQDSYPSISQEVDGHGYSFNEDGNLHSSHEEIGASSCTYPLEDYVAHSRLTPSYSVSVANISSTYEPSVFHPAVQIPDWKLSMDEELKAMENLKTWLVISLPTGKKAIACKWLYRIKRKADGTIDRYKARPVAKWFT